MKKDAMEQLDMCCQTGCLKKPIEDYIEELEQEISDLKTALDVKQSYSKYEIERLERQLTILVLSCGIFLVSTVLMLIF